MYTASSQRLSVPPMWRGLPRGFVSLYGVLCVQCASARPTGNVPFSALLLCFALARKPACNNVCAPILRWYQSSILPFSRGCVAPRPFNDDDDDDDNSDVSSQQGDEFLSSERTHARATCMVETRLSQGKALCRTMGGLLRAMLAHMYATFSRMGLHCSLPFSWGCYRVRAC